MAADMVPGPEVEHHSHHHTGRHGLDIALAVCAVFISLISLLLAIQHGRAMEKMVQVSSWPYVVVQDSNANSDGSRRFTLSIANNGVGPARIESIEMVYDGKPQRDGRSLIRSMLKIEDPSREIRSVRSDVIDAVLPAREKITLLDVLPGQLSPEEYDTLRRESANTWSRVCYCSVFDECWVLDQSKRVKKAEEVKACPVPRTMYGD